MPVVVEVREERFVLRKAPARDVAPRFQFGRAVLLPRAFLDRAVEPQVEEVLFGAEDPIVGMHDQVAAFQQPFAVLIDGPEAALVRHVVEHGRHAAVLEDREHVGFVPRAIAELDRDERLDAAFRPFLLDRIEEAFERGRIDLHRGRQLEEDAAEFFSERAELFPHRTDVAAGVLQAAEVRDDLARLHRERETVRGGVDPALDRRRRDGAVERHVDFHRVELRGEERQMVRGLHALRVERVVLPVAVGVAGGADQGFHARVDGRGTRFCIKKRPPDGSRFHVSGNAYFWNTSFTVTGTVLSRIFWP